jgi:hypothetical protein
MKTMLLGTSIAFGLLCAAPAFAQDAGSAPPPPAGADLAGVPSIEMIHAREDRDGMRIQNAASDGDLSPNEAHRVREELANIRTQEAELAHRDGPDMTATDRQFINDRLNQLGQSIHWIRTRAEAARW